MKREIGFEEYLEHAKQAPSRLFLKFCSGTQELFQELCRHNKGGEPQECSNCGACKESVEHAFSECASYDFQGLDFLYCFRTVLPPDAFKTFLCVSIFEKIVFYLGQKQGMLVNNECTS